MEKDPVCGMEVDPQQAVERRTYEGKEYYFCNRACSAQFDQAPQRYVGQQKQDRE